MQTRRSPSWAIAPIVVLNTRSLAFALFSSTENQAIEVSTLLKQSALYDFGYQRQPIKSGNLVKEVIQPQVPLRLPCYDFTPVMNHKVVSALPKVMLPTSFATHSHGVTGGVYKARERIHRDIADSRLLAIPTSRSRVADCDPDYEKFSGISWPSRDRNPLYFPL